MRERERGEREMRERERERERGERRAVLMKYIQPCPGWFMLLCN